MSDMIMGPEVEAGTVDVPRRDFAANLGEAVRDNPVSAALIAMGAVWLFVGGSRVTILGSRRSRAEASEPYPTAHPAPAVLGLRAEGAAATIGDAGRSAANAAQDAGQTVGDLAGRSREAAGEAVQRAANVADEVATGVVATARRTGKTLSDVGAEGSRAARRTATSAWHEAEDLGRSVREMLEERPLAIAALGLTAGAGLALALPRTDVEQDLVGEQSQALRRQARSVAARGLDDAREGGEAALARAMRDARAYGLSESAMKATVEEFTAKLEKVVLAVRDASKGEG